MDAIKENHTTNDNRSPARPSIPAGSRARKRWAPEEETLLLQIREQNPRVSWERLQPIFNSNLHASRHRTSDAIACKHKSINPEDVPSQSIPPSQKNETVSCNFTLCLATF